VTAARTPGRNRPAASPLDAVLSSVLGRRVRGLSVEIRGGHLFLRGRADSFHIKQLAQHAAMEVTELPLAANDIVVGPRRRMLVASGDDVVRAIGRATLGPLGWEVETAHDGLECVDHLRRTNPDVVVLDAELLWGGADGVLADIADGDCPNVPVVLLGIPQSVRAGDRDVRIAAILDKPFDHSALAWAVSAAADGCAADER
jgi:CheY-like chemotaxis protein